MGEFSWNCCECDKPILSDGPSIEDCCFKCEDALVELDGAKQKAYLINTDGTLLQEDNYEGYGVFGGVDAYGWLAHNNLDVIREWNGDKDFKLTKHPAKEDGIIFAMDRDLGIMLEHDTKKKTFEEIEIMLREKAPAGNSHFLLKHLYHYCNDLIKNPIKIICETCLEDKTRLNYANYEASNQAENQGWTSSHETDVGWVCEDCYQW